MLTLWQRVKDF